MSWSLLLPVNSYRSEICLLDFKFFPALLIYHVGIADDCCDGSIYRWAGILEEDCIELIRRGATGLADGKNWIVFRMGAGNFQRIWVTAHDPNGTVSFQTRSLSDESASSIDVTIELDVLNTGFTQSHRLKPGAPSAQTKNVWSYSPSEKAGGIAGEGEGWMSSTENVVRDREETFAVEKEELVWLKVYYWGD